MTTSKDLSPTLADDLLEGAKEIATFGGWKERQVYGELKSIFTLNGKLHARRSTLLREIQALEGHGEPKGGKWMTPDASNPCERGGANRVRGCLLSGEPFDQSHKSRPSAR